MVKVYAIALAIGATGLIAWIFLVYFAGNSASFTKLDPERRFGRGGRRVVAGFVGFGMAGLSSEFSPKDLSWPVALAISVLGAVGAMWFAGWVDRPQTKAGKTDSELASSGLASSGLAISGSPDAVSSTTALHAVDPTPSIDPQSPGIGSS